MYFFYRFCCFLLLNGNSFRLNMLRCCKICSTGFSTTVAVLLLFIRLTRTYVFACVRMFNCTKCECVCVFCMSHVSVVCVCFCLRECFCLLTLFLIMLLVMCVPVDRLRVSLHPCKVGWFQLYFLHPRQPELTSRKWVLCFNYFFYVFL